MVVPEILSTMSRSKGFECIQNGRFDWNGESFLCPTSGCMSENCNECWKSAVKRWCKKEHFKAYTMYKIKGRKIIFQTDTDETEALKKELVLTIGDVNHYNVKKVENC